MKKTESTLPGLGLTGPTPGARSEDGAYRCKEVRQQASHEV